MSTPSAAHHSGSLVAPLTKWWEHTMPAILQPVTTTDTRPKPGSPAMLYIRSYLVLRAIIGALGIALPIVVILGSRYVFHENQPFPRTSISNYYYSGAREFFVDILAATGVFFIAYKVFESNLENLFSWIAGLSAITITIFPTGKTAYDKAQHIGPNAVQKVFGESNVTKVHYVASAVFLISLALISIFFGIREHGRPQRQGQRLRPNAWAAIHWACSAIMAGGLLLAVVSSWRYALLTGEIICAAAFGTSWFTKGFELDTLRDAPAAIKPPN